MSQDNIVEVLREYYRDPAIRKRIREFLGGSEYRGPSAVYLVGNDGFHEFGDPASLSSLPEYLDSGLEIERSLWDRDSLVADIDIEYENFDAPASAWQDPARAFALQQPVLDAALRILRRFGIVPLSLLSGRGFHLVWAISRSSAAFHRLVRIGRVPPSLAVRYKQPGGVGIELGRSFAGLGLILEFIGHRVFASAASASQVPIKLASIEVGPGAHGREIVAFDLSEYGDPLETRHMRAPFSAYLKPKRFEWALGKSGIAQVLPIFTIPLVDGISAGDALPIARNPQRTAELAQGCAAFIPDASAAMDALMNEYEASSLAAFHNEFYAEPWREGEVSAKICRATTLDAPKCVVNLLESPNDGLLKPAALQHVVRTLMALGRRPREIARVIYAAYRQDCGWGTMWSRLDPFNRAIFYTRLFAGLVNTGVDRLIDFNCVSHKEKGYCTIPDCSSNLATFRDVLQGWRTAH